MTLTANKPNAASPAMASRLQPGRHWRGVADPERFLILPRVQE